MIGGGGGGVSAGNAGGGASGGLCVFSCAAALSAIGALAALYDYDLGSESAFFAISGLGALCFAKCQYLKLAEQKSRVRNPLYRSGWESDDADLYSALAKMDGSNGIMTRRRRADNRVGDLGVEWNNNTADSVNKRKGKRSKKQQPFLSQLKHLVGVVS